MDAPKSVVDFDGTLVELNVEWARLRRLLGYRTVAESQAPEYWSPLRAAEMARLETAPVNESLVEELSKKGRFAVFTNNSEAVVRAFLKRYPALEGRCVAVVGRETLLDAKQNQAAFTRGVDLCREALGSREGEPWRYIGDSGYELRFALRAGAQARDARQWWHGAPAPALPGE